MKRLIIILTAALLTVTGTTWFSPAALAADKAPAAAQKPAKPRARPVSGKVQTIDSTLKTITLSGEKKQVLYVTSETKLNKEGKPAMFSDIVVGEIIGGSAVEVDGKLMLKTLRIGPKPGNAKPRKAKKPAAE